MKLKLYFNMLVVAGVILYLATYFLPLSKDYINPFKGPVVEMVGEYGLNSEAVIMLTALLVTFLFVLTVTLLAGRELEKKILNFIKKLRE